MCGETVNSGWMSVIWPTTTGFGYWLARYSCDFAAGVDGAEDAGELDDAGTVAVTRDGATWSEIATWSCLPG